MAAVLRLLLHRIPCRTSVRTLWPHWEHRGFWSLWCHFRVDLILGWFFWVAHFGLKSMWGQVVDWQMIFFRSSIVFSAATFAAFAPERTCWAGWQTLWEAPATDLIIWSKLTLDIVRPDIYIYIYYTEGPLRAHETVAVVPNPDCIIFQWMNPWGLRGASRCRGWIVWASRLQGSLTSVNGHKPVLDARFGECDRSQYSSEPSVEGEPHAVEVHMEHHGANWKTAPRLVTRAFQAHRCWASGEGFPSQSRGKFLACPYPKYKVHWVAWLDNRNIHCFGD